MKTAAKPGWIFMRIIKQLLNLGKEFIHKNKLPRGNKISYRVNSWCKTLHAIVSCTLTCKGGRMSINFMILSCVIYPDLER